MHAVLMRKVLQSRQLLLVSQSRQFLLRLLHRRQISRQLRCRQLRSCQSRLRRMGSVGHSGLKANTMKSNTLDPMLAGK